VGGSDAALIRGSLDDENARWWALWRRRVKKEAAADANGNDLGSDAEDEVSYTRNLKKNRSKKGAAVNGEKRRKVVKIKSEQEEDDDVEDADVSMLADNEFEGDEEKKEVKQVSRSSSKTKTSFWGDLDGDDAFKSLAVDEIKLNERAMHEDMRILIKVRSLLYLSIIRPADFLFLVGHHCCLDQT